MVIFHSYVSLPEGTSLKKSLLFFPRDFPLHPHGTIFVGNADTTTRHDGKPTVNPATSLEFQAQSGRQDILVGGIAI
jgi:hypothetical protein